MTDRLVHRMPPWLGHLRRVESFVIRGESLFCALALAVMLGSTALMVLARNAAWPWPNYGELGMAAAVPLTLVGGALCTALGSHVTIDIIRMLPSRGAARLAETAGAAATLVFAWIFAGSGLHLVKEFRLTGDHLLDLGTPLWLLALFFPIGMTLMAFHAVMRVLIAFWGSSGETAQDEMPS